MADEEEEFQEEEIWAAVKDRHCSPHASRNPNKAREPKKAHRHRSSPSSRPAQEGAGSSRQSAPVNIPDWSKIYGKGGAVEDNDDSDGGGEGEGEEEQEKVPPHEWLARKMARSRISSFSVCEGAGRTLKGRDLSRVRNTVLTRTGFLEQQ